MPWSVSNLSSLEISNCRYGKCQILCPCKYFLDIFLELDTRFSKSKSMHSFKTIKNWNKIRNQWNSLIKNRIHWGSRRGCCSCPWLWPSMAPGCNKNIFYSNIQILKDTTINQTPIKTKLSFSLQQLTTHFETFCIFHTNKPQDGFIKSM